MLRKSGPSAIARTLCFREPFLGTGSGRHGSEGTAALLTEAEASPSIRFAVKTSDHSGRSRSESPRANAWFLDGLQIFRRVASCSARLATSYLALGLVPVVILCTGLCSESPRADSCDEDSIGVRAGLDLEASLVRPGTTMGT